MSSSTNYYAGGTNTRLHRPWPSRWPRTYIRPTSISFLRICQSPATDVVVVACFRGVFFVSSLIGCLLSWALFIEKTVLLCFARFLFKWRETTLWMFPDANELYVWMLSRRRRSRRELVSSCWKRGRREWRWRLAGRGNWWRGRLVRKNWLHCQQWTKPSVFQLTKLWQPHLISAIGRTEEKTTTCTNKDDEPLMMKDSEGKGKTRTNLYLSRTGG